MEEPKTFRDYQSYPTEDFLQWVRDFKSSDDLEPFVNCLRKGWWMPEWGFIFKRKYGGYRALELHTGGWSGNEDIIDALRSNIYFWRYWKKMTAGGHYYFRIPVLKIPVLKK